MEWCSPEPNDEGPDKGGEQGRRATKRWGGKDRGANQARGKCKPLEDFPEGLRKSEGS